MLLLLRGTEKRNVNGWQCQKANNHKPITSHYAKITVINHQSSSSSSSSSWTHRLQRKRPRKKKPVRSRIINNQTSKAWVARGSAQRPKGGGSVSQNSHQTFLCIAFLCQLQPSSTARHLQTAQQREREHENIIKDRQRDREERIKPQS